MTSGGALANDVQDLGRAGLDQDSFETVTRQPVRLKFQLGEWVLGSWRPQMLVLDPKGFGEPGWPAAPSQMANLLDSQVRGLLCRKVAAGQFGEGLGRYGVLLSYVSHRDVQYCVQVQGTFAEYLKQRFSPKSRQNLQRSVRKFGERQKGEPAWEVHTQRETMARFHAEALAISKQTYQTLQLDAGLPAGPAFLAHIEQLADEGRARGYLLRDCGRAIAFAWCRRQGDRLVYDTVGYLPEFAAHSPGSVLLFHLLEDVFADGRFKLVDFGPGEAQYKSLFATSRTEFADLYLFRRKLWIAAVLLSHRGVMLAGGAVGRLLERFGVKKRVKALMRWKR